MNPRSQEDFQQIKDERREKIVFAALKVFARNGFAGTKISDIAREAQSSHGLIYYYFNSKEQIYDELLKNAIDSSNQSVAQLAALPLPPLEKLEVMTRTVLQFITENEDTAYYFYLMIQVHMSPYVPEVVKVYSAQPSIPMLELINIIQTGQADGSIRNGDPVQMALVYWAAIQGIAVSQLSQHPPFTLTVDPFLALFKP